MVLTDHISSAVGDFIVCDIRLLWPPVAIARIMLKLECLTRLSSYNSQCPRLRAAQNTE